MHEKRERERERERTGESMHDEARQDPFFVPPQWPLGRAETQTRAGKCDLNSVCVQRKEKKSE